MMEEIIHRLLDGDSQVLDGINDNDNNNNSSLLSPSINEITNLLNNNSKDGNGDDVDDENKIGSMGFTQEIQNELLPLLQEDLAFDVFTNCLTCPSLSENGADDHDNHNNTKDEDKNKDDVDVKNNYESKVKTNANTTTTKQIKRSFRTMTLLVNDTNAAQQLHQQIGISNIANMNKKQQSQLLDEEKVYSKYLLSPTRAVVLARKIFSAYHEICLHYCRKYNVQGEKQRKIANNFQPSSILASCHPNGIIQSNQRNRNGKKEQQHTTTRNSDEKIILPHLPHLNKTLTALLAAYPKQVILASCSTSTDNNNINIIQQTLEPMLQLQTFCSDYSSPMQTLVDIIIMGCTGKKRENSNLQQQQAMMMAAAQNAGGVGGIADPGMLMNQIYIGCTYRKKFVRCLSQWGLVQNFVNVIASHSIIIPPSSSSSSSTTVRNVGGDGSDNDQNLDVDNDHVYYEHVAESACDALMTIMEFICFPQQLHPSLAMNMGPNLLNNENGKNSDDAKKAESAGEEELFTPLTNVEVISQLANCASFRRIFNESRDNIVDVIDMSPNNYADASSRTLLGLFEIATGKARKTLMTPAMDITEVDEGAVECKAQKEDQPKELPGIDDNKLLKAGITSSMHSTLVSNIELIVKAMDIRVKAPQNAEGKNEVEEPTAENAVSGAVNHPGRYTIERPFTSRRLDLITLFADILSYENHNENKVNLVAAIKAMDALTELPIPAPNEETNHDTVYSPWPGLCDFLFDYPENSLYGIQFYRILHAICMTNHEKTLKIVVQKCKFLSKAIKECKNKISRSNRGVLLKCLNALRLHSQSIGPYCFLRHYFDSHDGWKAFETDLKK